MCQWELDDACANDTKHTYCNFCASLFMCVLFVGACNLCVCVFVPIVQRLCVCFVSTQSSNSVNHLSDEFEMAHFCCRWIAKFVCVSIALTLFARAHLLAILPLSLPNIHPTHLFCRNLFICGLWRKWYLRRSLQSRRSQYRPAASSLKLSLVCFLANTNNSQ